MPDVIGIDHIYLTVSDMERSEKFYDVVMAVIGFRKNRFQLNGEQHIQYYNRHFAVVLRPARDASPHNPYAPGLHHLCLRVEGEKEVRAVADALKERSIHTTGAGHYPEYAPDYFAVFFTDPNGIRLEVTNYRQERRQRYDGWENSAP